MHVCLGAVALESWSVASISRWNLSLVRISKLYTCTVQSSHNDTKVLTLGAVGLVGSNAPSHICMCKFVGIEYTYTCVNTHAVQIRS